MKDQLELGETHKADGIAIVKEHNEDWMSRALHIVEGLSREGDFTSDDVRFAVGLAIGLPKHANCWGALLNSAAKAGYIKRTGFRKSPTPSRHAAWVSVWTRKVTT